MSKPVTAIEIRGARAGNLQNLDLKLTHGAWTAVHGASGAGKSALLFGLLAPVSRRRFRLLEDPAALPGGGEAWLAPLADEVRGLHPVIAGAGDIPRGRRQRLLVDALDLWPLLAAAWEQEGHYRCVACAKTWRPPQVAALLPMAAKWPQGATILVAVAAAGQAREQLLQGGWTRFRLDGRLQRLEEAADELPPGSALLLDRFKWREDRLDRWREALEALLARGVPGWVVVDEHEHAIPAAAQCPACGHTHASHAWPDWHHRADVSDRVVLDRDWSQWLAAALSDWAPLRAYGQRGAARAAARRLDMLQRTGLGHLAADRSLGTLSLGEARRLELSSWIAQVRQGQTVLLDEPGMGLHGHERHALAVLLQGLVAQGNTVLTADPAREFLEAAHYWLWLGPGGGPQGGQVVGQGPRQDLPAEAWPSLEEMRPAPATSEPSTLRFGAMSYRSVQLEGLELPLQRLVAFCGVSGSGKSTLLEKLLLPALRGEAHAPTVSGPVPPGGVTSLLERALRWSPWSTVATLCGAWGPIREAFAEGEEGRIRGLRAADLVARPGQGACHRCQGHGLDGDGLPCSACEGLGLREDLLALRLRQRELRSWLTTPLAKLEKRLPARGRLRATVRHLVDLGLGERHFAERGRFLSLGERGRLALARALATARRDRPKLFLLDEPCLGLPLREARQVVALLRRLCAEGHSVWVVEHHEYLLRAADDLVELGPGAGREGGRVVFHGEPSAVVGQDTATGRWFAAREAPAKAPPPPRPWRAMASAILPEDGRRLGRQRLEGELRRELAMRSPLLQDQVDGPSAWHQSGEAATIEAEETGEAAAYTPVAWPTAPPANSRLLAILGLEESFLQVQARDGLQRCAACGGSGPWADLVEATTALPDSGPWLFTSPLPARLLAKEEHPSWLQAAGFRRFLRAGKTFRWTRQAQQALRAGDGVCLDELALDEEDAVGRLRDVAHQASLLGAGEVHIHPATAVADTALSFHPAACRDCGRREVDMVAHLGQHAVAGLREGRLDHLLQVTADQPSAPPSFRRALELLAPSSLLARPAIASWRELSEDEQRIARLVGCLLFPIEGVALLADQPLAGLPPEVARRLGAAMVAGPGHFRFTDPDGWLADEEERLDWPLAIFPDLTAPAAFAWESWTQPSRAAAGQRLRQALGVEHELRQYFLRTEGARLNGWTAKDLDPRHSPFRCPWCKGSGEHRPHPELRLACRHCQGRGWGPRLAAVEDRGLRWMDLGRSTVAELAEHFAHQGSLGAVFAAARELQLGTYCLDQPLAELPLGVRMLAPLAAELDVNGVQELRVGLAFAGYPPLELLALARTMGEFFAQAAHLEWRERHPLLTQLEPR